MALCAWLHALWLQAQPLALGSQQSNIMVWCIVDLLDFLQLWAWPQLQTQHLALIKNDLLVDCWVALDSLQLWAQRQFKQAA